MHVCVRETKRGSLCVFAVVIVYDYSCFSQLSFAIVMHQQFCLPFSLLRFVYKCRDLYSQMFQLQEYMLHLKHCFFIHKVA